LGLMCVDGTCGESIGVGGESGSNGAGADDIWSGLVDAPGPLLIPGVPSEGDSLEASSADTLRSQ